MSQEETGFVCRYPGGANVSQGLSLEGYVSADNTLSYAPTWQTHNKPASRVNCTFAMQHCV